VVKSFGAYQTVSGLVPESLALARERTRILAEMPKRFADDMAVQEDEDIAAGMSKEEAALRAFGYGVNVMKNFYGTDPDAANWLNQWETFSQDFIGCLSRWAPTLESVFPSK